MPTGKLAQRSAERVFRAKLDTSHQTEHHAVLAQLVESKPTKSAGIQCTPCLENLFSTGNGTLCTACPSGREPNEQHDGCDECLPGFAGIDGVCHPCAKGQEPDSPPHSCIDCEHGSGTVSVDGVQCRPCQAGKQPNVGSTCDVLPWATQC